MSPRPDKFYMSCLRMVPAALCLILTVVIVRDSSAKRVAPKPVSPVIHNGVKYVAGNENGFEARIEAWNQKTGEKLWDVVIYTIKPKPDLEEDVQWVFITRMEIRDNALLVINEKNRQFTIDLKSRK